MDGDRETLPLNGPGRYRVEDGRVRTRSLEINAVDHCNLSCRACSHASPVAAKSAMSPEIAYDDLTKLTQVIRVENVRIVGGEPLLHNDLPALLSAVRDSGIADQITLVTNGLLMDRVDPAIWDLVSKVEVSLYPLTARMTGRVRDAVSQIAERGVSVDILKYTTFREAMAAEATTDAELVHAVYRTCQIAHFWRCITVDRGWLFRCPQSLYRTRISGVVEHPSDARRIDLLKDVEAILAFLESTDPLTACWNCLGSAGAAVPHQQISRRTWLGSIGQRPEDVVDSAYLAKLLTEPRAASGCMTRTPIHR